MNIEFSWFMVFKLAYDILTTIGPDGLIFVNFIRGPPAASWGLPHSGIAGSGGVVGSEISRYRIDPQIII